MKMFPLFANLAGRRTIVVGGGPVAERKVRLLLQADANIVVVSPDATHELTELARLGRITIVNDVFHEGCLDDAWFVVAATNDHTLNQHVAALCEQRRLFINVIDDAALSSVQIPAIVDRSPLTIAISSAGNAPMIARRLRERIEQHCEHSLGPITTLAGKYRQAIRRHIPNPRQRREFYDWMLDGPVKTAINANQPAWAEEALEQALVDGARQTRHGLVILVGAGPGDPGLLTLSGLRALNRADVILYDRLVSADIVNLARRDAIRIAVGKTPGQDHNATQARIHRLLLHHAQAGHCVVRLKGGDPMVFGRGGEELEFLRAHAIDYHVVPGITAAVACAAYAGVPLTHRDHAQSVRFVTVQRKNDTDTTDWRALAQDTHTLAFYMGVGRLSMLATRLIANGRSCDTPFALIENGTRATQRVLTGKLNQLSEQARKHNIKAPALLLVGAVAELATSLHWFGTRIADDADVRGADRPGADVDIRTICLPNGNRLSGNRHGVGKEVQSVE